MGPRPGIRLPLAGAFLVSVLVPGFILAQRDISIEQLIGKYAQPPSRFVMVDSLAVHLRDEGQGSAVVLLHGMFASLHTWDGWVAALNDTFRLIRCDLPGFGLTGPWPDGEYTLTRYVDFLDALMDSLEVESLVLAGNSLGGGIAWQYSLSHPERVSALVLIDAVGYPRKRAPLVVRLGRIPVVRQLFRFILPRFVIRLALKGAYGDDSRITPELIDRYHDLILRDGNRRALLGMLRRKLPDGSDRIRDIQIPSLIMWGEEDAWIPLEHSRRFQEDLSQSRLVVYPGAGHAPMEEIPEITAHDVRRFLSAVMVP
jgi:pimeloyl-ACP methyl ester carboxylesterase